MGPGSKKRSPVWKYFTKNADSNKFATCNICKKILSFYGSTTNLKQHLIRIHPLIKIDDNDPPRENNDENENIENGDVAVTSNLPDTSDQ